MQPLGTECSCRAERMAEDIRLRFVSEEADEQQQSTEEGGRDSAGEDRGQDGVLQAGGDQFLFGLFQLLFHLILQRLARVVELVDRRDDLADERVRLL